MPFIKHEIEESAFGYHERYRTRQDIVVGVNEYVEDEAEVEEILSVDPESERAQVERLQAVQGRARPGRGATAPGRAASGRPRARTTCCRRSGRR